MGIDIRDRLMVGATYDELTEFFEKKIDEHEEDEYLYDAGDVIEEYFDHMSPYYDSSRYEWFIGFRVDNDEYVDQELFNNLRKAAEKFETLTGVKATLKGGAHVF